MKTPLGRTKTLLSALIVPAMLGSAGLLAQCPNNNVPIAGGAITPNCPGTTVVPCVTGGQYALVNVVAGNMYTFSTCGGAGWDTEITLYTSGGVMVGYNDDACGLQSTVTWFATYTGQLRVLLDAWSYWFGIPISPCQSNSTCAAVTITCATVGPGVCAPAAGQFPGSGSIQIQQNLTPTQLIQDVFLGECLTASNVLYTGTNSAIGTFTNGWRIGTESGIVLTTGNANQAVGPNASPSTSTANGQPGYPLLTMLAGVPTYDASVIRFNFVPQTNSVTFSYVFASEEYPEWVCDTYNDVFGFFVSGPGYAPNTNIASVPGTIYPVAIDHVNNNGWCAPFFPNYFQANPPNAPHNEYDGFTVPLTACINTVPCETYTIIIAVADAGDALYDSAVFLEAESFSAGVDLQIGATADQVTVSDEDNCVDFGYFIFSIDQPLGQDVTLTYTIDQIGDPVYDPPIPVQVTFPAGQPTVILPVNALPGSLGPDVS